MRNLLILAGIVGLMVGCEQNAHVRVGTGNPVLLSSPPETALTSSGTLHTSTQNVREGLLAVARDLNLTVLQQPPAGIEGEAILQAPTGSPIRVHYRETAPGRVELTVRRDSASVDEQIDSLTRRIYDTTRDRALSGDPAGPRNQ
jgi:hypothetical protein